MNSRRRELRGNHKRKGHGFERRRPSNDERRSSQNEEGCFKCGKKGHFSKECRVGTSYKSQQNEGADKGKKKESFVA
ncbi:hypothetical protein J0J30_23190 [Vibrio vulnificus]|nr:hypothetical protein [Vibrio vulnificus]